MADAFDAIESSRYFSTLDLRSVYWQISMKRNDIEKTAFITQDGLFQFTKMPYGLSNAPSVFQKTMDIVLGGLKGCAAFVFLNDVFVDAPTFEKHFENLELVLQRLEEYNLTIKP